MITLGRVASVCIKATRTMLMTLMADGSVTVCVLVLTEPFSAYIYICCLFKLATRAI